MHVCQFCNLTMKKGDVLFNAVCNTCFKWLYGVGHVVNVH